MSKQNERLFVFNKFKGKCAYCGCNITLKGFHVDHIICKELFVFYVKNKHKVPDFLKHLSENDCEHIDNKFPSCQSCNIYKRAETLENFRSNVSELIRQLERTVQWRIAKRFGMVEETNTPIKFYFETQ